MLDSGPTHLLQLSICAIFKNEAPFLKEWIEYHKLVGVQHFYLYNNNSEDEYLEILKPYLQQNEVTLINWPNQKLEEWNGLSFPWVETTQKTAYGHAFQIAKQTSEWIIPLDLDEFIIPVSTDTITEGLKKYQNMAQIQIYETTYGTADIDSIPAHLLLIETLNKKTCSSYPKQKTKTIFNLHKQKNEKKSILASPNDFVINHYTNRCIDNFYKQKIKNKSMIYNTLYHHQEIIDMLTIGNDQVDRECPILRFSPYLREKLQLPNVDIAKKTIYSFDLFDTLIGRLHHSPDCVFQLVEKKYPYPNFAHLRKLAEQQCKGPKNLENIYKEFKKMTSSEDVQMKQLLDFEWEIEMEHIFPILENLTQVCHGDIIISDTYYNSEQLKALLSKAGLKKKVKIICSPSGKKSGSIWEFLSKTVKIDLHIGDNYHADILNASHYHIPVQYYESSQLSQNEQDMIDLGQQELAYLMRALRLQNPYIGNSPEHLIWNEQSQINIPILIQSSIYLDQFCKTHKKNRILFSSRDTCLWIKIFKAMFPNYTSLYFHSSRQAYREPSLDYIEYVRSIYTGDSIIVDGHGSGTSCIDFFKEHMQTHPTYLAIVYWDTAPGNWSTPDSPRYGIVKTSEGWSDKIEYLNNDYVGSLKNFEQGKPTRLPCEFSEKYVDASHFCVEAFMKIYPYYEIHTFEKSAFNLSMKHLKKQMISHLYLPHITDHFPKNNQILFFQDF
jgi:hypothetical protein